MKKILLTILVLIIGINNFKAQNSIQLTNNSTGNPITNNSVILEDVAAGQQSHVYIQLKNISSDTVIYAVKKTEVVINDSADAYFCWGGVCFPTTTTITPTANYVKLGAAQVDAPQSFYYDENGTSGYSEIKYELYNVNNPNDAVVFTFKFNPLLASIKNNVSLFSSVSDVYPNPSVNRAQILVNSTVFVNNATVSIINALGSVVSVKNIELSAGKNIVLIDSDKLTSGVYYATISSNNNRVVKKFIVNK